MGEIGIKQTLKQRVSIRRISVTMRNTYQLLNMYQPLHYKISTKKIFLSSYFLKEDLRPK